jgi:arginase
VDVKRIVVPFLTGLRRDGLTRINDIGGPEWSVLHISGFAERELAEVDERFRRMGAIYKMLSEAVCGVVRDGATPVVVSGDCIGALGVLAGLQKAGRPPDRLLWLDAHGDFHTWATTRTNYPGGMPLAMLVGRRDRRSTRCDPVGDLVREVGVTPFAEHRIVLSDARDLDEGEREALASSEIVRCGLQDIYRYIDTKERLYLHWDTDVVDDPVHMPALKYHVPGGPSCETLAALFRSLRQTNIVAVSVSAWHEELDLDNKTAAVFLQLLADLELERAPLGTPVNSTAASRRWRRLRPARAIS